MTFVKTQWPKEGEEVLGTEELNYSASTAGGECLQPGVPQQGQVYRMHQRDPDLLVWLVPMPAGTTGQETSAVKTKRSILRS